MSQYGVALEERMNRPSVCWSFDHSGTQQFPTLIGPDVRVVPVDTQQGPYHRQWVVQQGQQLAQIGTVQLQVSDNHMKTQILLDREWCKLPQENRGEGILGSILYLFSYLVFGDVVEESLVYKVNRQVAEACLLYSRDLHRKHLPIQRVTVECPTDNAAGARALESLNIPYKGAFSSEADRCVLHARSG